MILIGPHTTKQATPNKQREEARNNGWGVIQTFSGPPQTLRLDPAKVSSDNDRQRDVLWVVHSSYPAFFVPRKDLEEVNASYMYKLAKWAANASATHLVVHLGATKDQNPKDVIVRGKEYWNTQDELKSLLAESGVKLLVENVAANYPMNNDLTNMLELISGGSEILGWCLDTAHSNAAGISPEIVMHLITNKQDCPDIVHCNYPGSKFLSGRDIHGWLHNETSPLSQEEKDQWKEMVRSFKKKEIPLVLEGGSMDGDMALEIEAMRSL